MTSPALTRKRSPEPDTIAVRTAPDSDDVLRNSDQLQRRRKLRRRALLRPRQQPDARGPGALRTDIEAKQIARVRGAGCRARCVRAAARFPTAARRMNDRARWAVPAAAGRPAREHQRSTPTRTTSQSRVPTRRTRLRVARSCNVADRSTTVWRLCYYSSCTLHRLVLRSILRLRSKSSPSFPLDSPLPASPANHSPTSTAAR